MHITLPDYDGGSLVNLISEIEHRLIGSAPSPRLHAHLAEHIPDAETYVLCLFDGLGAGQLDHPVAVPLQDSLQAAVDCPFPATTTVSLSVLATGLPPSQHGLLGYQAWIPELEVVANTLQWTTLWGDPLDYELEPVLPAPNLAERLGAAGVETITIQPGNFLQTNLTKVLFRGNRFEGIWTLQEWVDATVQLAAQPNRLVVAYLPHVDVAAHVSGQESEEYAEALGAVAAAWESVVNRLPQGAVALATADHGHIDFPPHKQVKIDKEDHEGRVFYGDGRAMFVKGEGASLAAKLPATWVPVEEMAHWWGPGPHHPQFWERAPDGVLVADDDVLLLHRFSNSRLIGNHGALTDAERMIPLLVGSGE
ncbi:MAG: alkaline phosphatase family protein [Acidimicrobiia bacterium]|nr:alkaline phosphatase family protein [Acidimicrobiia bacterium]